MVSFQELHEADFSGVTETAEAWANMAKALDGLDGRVGRDLTNTPQRAGWQGGAADDAGRTLQTIDTDFTQAAGVARALAAIIKDAAEDFTAARRDLDTALHDAAEQKLTVAADGAVSWPPMSSEGRNDPDYQEVQRKYQEDMKGKAEAISNRLTKAVEKAAAADQRASTALQGDVGTGTTSFNPHPYGGGDVADAKRATDLMSKGGSLSDEERKRLQDLMAANSGSKDFSTTLLNGLKAGDKTGPDALLVYAKVYGDLSHGDRNAKDYQDIHGNLSQVLATATKDGGMGKEWEDNLLKAARKPGGSAAGFNDNYPALTELMGAKGTYDKGFLEKVGNDLVDYERNSKRKGEELWGPLYSGVTDKQGDPMGGLMRAMSRNPEASKEFLDPAANKNLDYLLKERKWPNQGYEDKQFDGIARNTSRGAFGDALEAAATGRDPHGNQPPRQHDAAMSRIMNETVATLGGDKAGAENSLPAGLRRPLGNMIADYAPDVHEILGKEIRGGSEPDGLTFSREQLLRTIRGAAEDPEAFRVIHTAESQEIARRMDTYGPEDFKPDATGRVNPKFAGFTQEAGQALGALDGVRGDVLIDHREDEKFKNNWQSKIDYHIYGTPVNYFLPAPFGDIAQRLVDVGTADYANKANAELDTKAQGDLSKNYSAGEEQLKAMIEYKAALSGLSQKDMDATGGVPQQLMEEVTQNYSTAIDRTYNGALGRG
ncbi:DUF6571 family protein [Kitasatospora sp. A2-31]|uniref:DUF6571 family protein n=2 Tax=Kitasatospora sp. A2-31 TaxID=2916414 RepID=UPI001EE89BBB|nr:DUF6571 family protein [Kitasatospora sp. A2-31]MCG6492946.1 hypothetical protein [Kitasatospora sp. A2-31]